MFKAKILVLITEEKNGLDVNLSFKGKPICQLHNTVDISRKRRWQIHQCLLRDYTEVFNRIFGDRNWELAIQDLT